MSELSDLQAEIGLLTTAYEAEESSRAAAEGRWLQLRELLCRFKEGKGSSSGYVRALNYALQTMSELDAGQRVSLWRPISTVPKDGRWVLLRGDGWDLPEIARWVDGGWQCAETGHVVVLPTLWMECP